MRARPASRARATAVAVVALVIGLAVVGGCARKYQAERDGKDIGEALCDIRGADDPAAAEAARADLEQQVDDLAEDLALFTAEDRADISENISDLVEHISQGNDALVQQDIAVIRRSLDNIRDDLSDSGKAAVDGVLQGLDDCIER